MGIGLDEVSLTAACFPPGLEGPIGRGGLCDQVVRTPARRDQEPDRLPRSPLCCARQRVHHPVSPIVG